ncbi:hypothetical protein IC582_027727 [Cucumis melo]|uniref:Uncharacterized protein LOC103497166 isoform X1 n=1 Tax=Cucumis melo TaxID=3656 RepID=A0A1S3C5L4_CUCME|nr:uncharacterized protein LOC103497166 isoform X1 [Cucumis melo]
MATPSFHDLKKQASFFFKEKIKTARLALTDVTSAELLTEEAINGNPDARTLSSISRAAFEVDDYWRIVAILHKRLVKFEKKNWRNSYNSLIILEHLLTHGPESVAKEFESEKHVITQMANFQYVDEKGFNWGISVRKRSERILNLLDKGSLLKNEREKARKLTREILGFGSFSMRSNSQGIFQHPSSPIARYGKCNSNFNSLDNNILHQDGSAVDGQKIKMLETREGVEDNFLVGINKEELLRWDDDGVCKVKPVLSGKREEEELKNGISSDGYDHPFIDDELKTNFSLLSR